MLPLDKSLRNRLERTIKDARDIAEAAARASLEQLGVGVASAFSHLSEDERELRRKLRVHGRQLGDSLNGGKVQSMDRLIEEVAYEHWHRMLFARFLAENNLLMYDGVAVTLEECTELAVDDGLRNEWELAARLATAMLPQIFRTDSVVFALHFPPEHQQRLERLLSDLVPEVFTTSDSLGWVYQFWQAKKKDEVNASEVKIGARELPAVTQLFTEPYMVSFLLDNSLGAWWAARRLSEADLKSAVSEEELRAKAAIPCVSLEYLRFTKIPSPLGVSQARLPAGEGEGEAWTPAAGTFDGWPENLSELKTLDPCCGSGHFLVAALLMLVAMRMELEGLSAREAVDAVLRDNIHGLELDQRCVELAAFALALTAWRYPESGGYRPLPELHLACSGLSVSVAKEEWKQLALDKHNLRIALDWMYDAFKDAPVLGSLLDPKRSPMPMGISWEEVGPLLGQALQQEQSDEQQEAAVVAQGLTKAATLLAGQYSWVVTNVPYLSRGKQDERLRDFCGKHYPAAKNDLATVFLDRCLELASPPLPPEVGRGKGKTGGTVSVVLPQNWLFLTSYKKFREKLLKNDTWHLIARLGEGGFDSSAAAGAFVAMITLSRGNVAGQHGRLFAETDAANLIHGVDVSVHSNAADKAAGLITTETKQVEQVKQLENPDARVTLEEYESTPLLSEVADYGKGSTTGDAPRFLLYFWEEKKIKKHHVPWLNSPTAGALWSGRSKICTEPTDSPVLTSQLGCWLRGQSVWERLGVVVNKMRELEPFLYAGEVFDDNICPICPKMAHYIPAIWSFVESGEYSAAVRRIDQKLMNS